MFVVIGTWGMDAQLAREQREGLSRIVEGVSRAPGLVKGYWTSNEDGTRSHTFIVFEDAASAQSFAAAVRGNVTDQERAGVHNLGLEIHEVTAQS